MRRGGQKGESGRRISCPARSSRRRRRRREGRQTRKYYVLLAREYEIVDSYTIKVRGSEVVYKTNKYITVTRSIQDVPFDTL